MNKNYHIEATESTPEIILDRDINLYRISGDILPENSFDFFEPIFDWFNDYIENPDEKFILEFSINIINTSSTRRLVYLFKLLEKLADKGTYVKIIWIHLPDDEIMQYTAYEFGNAFTKINFETQLK
ncbi:MAG: DUF1987 domain-containing protein [Bacteroidales bacterium]|nr:DUF1987 domain-containing protein [Bacteroidales bacterium]